MPLAKLCFCAWTGGLWWQEPFRVAVHMHWEKVRLSVSNRRTTLGPSLIPDAAFRHSQAKFSVSERAEGGERQCWSGALRRQDRYGTLERGTSRNKTKLLPTQTDKKNDRIWKCLDIPNRLYPEVYQSLVWSNSYMSLKNYFLPPDNLQSIQEWPVIMISALKAKQKQTIKSFAWIYAEFQPLIKLSRGCRVSRLLSGMMA